MSSPTNLRPPQPPIPPLRLAFHCKLRNPFILQPDSSLPLLTGLGLTCLRLAWTDWFPLGCWFWCLRRIFRLWLHIALLGLRSRCRFSFAFSRLWILWFALCFVILGLLAGLGSRSNFRLAGTSPTTPEWEAVMLISKIILETSNTYLTNCFKFRLLFPWCSNLWLLACLSFLTLGPAWRITKLGHHKNSKFIS